MAEVWFDKRYSKIHRNAKAFDLFAVTRSSICLSETVISLLNDSFVVNLHLWKYDF